MRECNSPPNYSQIERTPISEYIYENICLRGRYIHITISEFHCLIRTFGIQTVSLWTQRGFYAPDRQGFYILCPPRELSNLRDELTLRICIVGSLARIRVGSNIEKLCSSNRNLQSKFLHVRTDMLEDFHESWPYRDTDKLYISPLVGNTKLQKILGGG